MGIVLIGYRGSGKTTTGRKLAERLGWPFVDTDEFIVRKSGRTIREIFDTDGEAGFRALETQALREVLRDRATVLALGGGAILRQQNQEMIARSGHHVVYLSADPAVLHQRITGDQATADNRPALTALGGSIDEVRQVLATREPIYRRLAHVEIAADQMDQNAIVEAILKSLPTGNQK